MVKQIGVFAIGLIIGFLLLRSCGPVKEKVITLSDTIYGDSIPYVVYRDKPVPYKVLVPSGRFNPPYNTLPKDTFYMIDTIEVLDDYSSAYFYSDTLKDDTSALIVLNEQITENKIEYRELIFQNRKLTTINHHYPANKNKLHLGAIGTLTGVSAEIGYSYKANQFGLIYGIQGFGLGYRRMVFEW